MAVTTAKDATATLDGTAVGYAKTITIGVSADLIKQHTMDSQDPAILKTGNRSYPISIDKLFIDSTHINQVTAGTAINLVVTPSGGDTYTVDSVILNNWELSISDPGALMSKVSGEGYSITIS